MNKEQNALEAERVAFEAWIVRDAGAGAVKRWPNARGQAYENDRVQDYRTGWVECYDWMTQARAQLAAPAGVADGCRLVPVVATLAMKNAGWQEIDRQGIDPESCEMQTIYHAMLAAAPSPAPASPNTIDLVFDGELPNAVFVEAEDGEGNSINAGHWFQREDGYWILRISSIERQLTQEEKDAAAHRYLARASAETWPKQECPVTGAVTWVEPEDMGIEPPASDVVQVPRELRPVIATILNALDRDAAEGKQARGEMAAELRALLNGGRV
jgi:hypothetical protein